jgi:hypothetical protein
MRARYSIMGRMKALYVCSKVGSGQARIQNFT